MTSVSTVDSGARRGWGTSDEGPGRYGVFWIGIWTFFLLDPLGAAWDRRSHVSGWIGMISVVVFAIVYVVGFLQVRRFGPRDPNEPGARTEGFAWLAIEVVLAVVVIVAIGQHGTATSVYLCVMCVMMLPNPWALTGAAAVAAVTYAAGFLVSGWSRDNGLLLSMLTASAAVWGIQWMLIGNAQLRRANSENRKLAVEEERTRFARDLHDILGHSLTVITVKAELAGRLLDVDKERARAELTDLERLSRDALADVRRAVEGYRDLTLPGELARARSALAAAQIEAELPNSTDEVPSDLRELFAWTVREGVTNVIKHSSARSCTVRLTTHSAEVNDDGTGPSGECTPGSGLLGLRERAAAVGATVVTRDLMPGHSLQVLA
jgi:two-component system sensor histidine kinase DesK